MAVSLVEIRISVKTRARCRIDLTADDRSDSGLPRSPIKIHDAEHGAVIRNGERIHTQLSGPFHQSFDARGSVEQAVFRMNMQMCKAHDSTPFAASNSARLSYSL